MDSRQFLHLETIVASRIFPARRMPKVENPKRWQKLLQDICLVYTHPQSNSPCSSGFGGVGIGDTSHMLDTLTKFSPFPRYPEITDNLAISTYCALLISYMPMIAPPSPKTFILKISLELSLGSLSVTLRILCITLLPKGAILFSTFGRLPI